MEAKNLASPRFVIAESVVIIIGVLLYFESIPVEAGIGLLVAILAAFQAHTNTPDL